MCTGETPTRRGGRRRRRLDPSESVSPSFRLDLLRFDGLNRDELNPGRRRCYFRRLLCRADVAVSDKVRTKTCDEEAEKRRSRSLPSLIPRKKRAVHPRLSQRNGERSFPRRWTFFAPRLGER